MSIKLKSHIGPVNRCHNVLHCIYIYIYIYTLRLPNEIDQIHGVKKSSNTPITKSSSSNTSDFFSIKVIRVRYGGRSKMCAKGGITLSSTEKMSLPREVRGKKYLHFWTHEPRQEERKREESICFIWQDAIFFGMRRIYDHGKPSFKNLESESQQCRHNFLLNVKVDTLCEWKVSMVIFHVVKSLWRQGIWQTMVQVYICQQNELAMCPIAWYSYHIAAIESGWKVRNPLVSLLLAGSPSSVWSHDVNHCSLEHSQPHTTPWLLWPVWPVGLPKGAELQC